MVGASMGFLWYNSHPAQVFMGDVGSLALGASHHGEAYAMRAEPRDPAISLTRS